MPAEGDRLCRQMVIAEARSRLPRLVCVFLSQAGCESKHQLNPLEFIQPVRQGRVELILFRRDDSSWATRAKSAQSQSTVAIESTISGSPAPFSILGEEQYNGNPTAAIDLQFLRKLLLHRPLNKSKVDLARVCLSNSLKKR